MEKYFNTTGLCVPELHYMVNINNKIKKIGKLINRGHYFTINRPRQFGKTTTLNMLEMNLAHKYLLISLSFEGIGDVIFNDEKSFCIKFIDLMEESLQVVGTEYLDILISLNKNIENLGDLSKLITEFIKRVNKDVILIIDEVDKSSNNQIFLSFLGVLRNKYLLRTSKRVLTFKSVILAGVHDIKTLKLKLRVDDDRKYNSPWNIAVNFDIDMSFNEEEISSMLDEYCQDNNIEMDVANISEKIYYYTNGYPFLVSRICQIIDEDILDGMKIAWDIELINKAVKQLLKERNTLFDDLFKNLENNEELKTYIFDIVFNGSLKVFNRHNSLIALGHLYGIFKDYDGIVKIDNRIFEQIIYNYFSSTLENTTSNIQNYNFRNNFLLDNGGLDIEKVILKFQQFMKEQYSNKSITFLETHGRTLFLAFLKPIINGVGFDFKEVQIAEEKRLDIVVTYNNFKYIIELKIWRGESYHEKGLHQLCDYLNIHDMNDGYLIVFNFNENKEYKEEKIIVDNKNIFCIYV